MRHCTRDSVLPGVDGGLPGIDIEDLPSEQEEAECPLMDGQCDGDCLRQPNEWYPLNSQAEHWSP